jgi:adenylate cyclase
VSVGPHTTDRDEEARTAPGLSALVRSLREEQERLTAEVTALREEVAALRRELAAPAPRRALRPLAAEPALTSIRERASEPIARRAVDTLVQVAAAAASAARIPLTLRPWAVALVLGLSMVGLAELNVFQPLEVFTAFIKSWGRGTVPVPHIAQRIVVVTVDDASLTELGPWGPRWRAHHGALLRHLADAGARAVGFDFYFKTPNEEFDRAFIDGIAYARARGTRIVLGAEYDASTQRVVEPPPALLAAATAIGSTYLTKDRVTNVIRYVAPFQEDRPPNFGGGSRLVPSLSAAVALAAGKRAQDLRPLGDGVIAIDFAGASRAFQTIPYVDAYGGRFPPAMVKDRHVMVGVVFRNSRDFFDTPTESQVAGVFIHANALYTMLRGLARPVPLAANVGVLLGAAGLTTLLCLRFQRLPRLVLILTTAAIYSAVAIWLGSRPDPLDLDIVPVILTICFVWFTLAMAEKINIREQFWKTLGLPSDAVRRLESEPGLLAGTLVKPTTILVVDARNYTVFTHDRAPQGIRDIIRQYHEMIERITHQHGGYINKFVGDAVVVVFGFPRSEEDTAMRAVLAALDVHEGVKDLRERWAREGKAGLEGLRMGINTGEVSVSYQGSSKRQLDILGENMDLAARLEDAARGFDAVALLGVRTHELVKDRVHAQCVSVSLKNLPHVTTAWALEGIVEAPSTDDASMHLAARR